MKTRLDKAHAQRNDLKRKVRELESEAARLANIAQERDQLKTRLHEAHAQRDDLKRRVRELENEAARLANRMADPDRYAQRWLSWVCGRRSRTRRRGRRTAGFPKQSTPTSATAPRRAG